ncbi:hypothetical protein Tco_1214910 [Tanacetum coccineum]
MDSPSTVDHMSLRTGLLEVITHQKPTLHPSTRDLFFDISGTFEDTVHDGLLEPVKIASTPLETNKALIKDEEAEDVDVHLYRLMIGSLMYLTASRPDIMKSYHGYDILDELDRGSNMWYQSLVALDLGSTRCRVAVHDVLEGHKTLILKMICRKIVGGHIMTSSHIFKGLVLPCTLVVSFPAGYMVFLLVAHCYYWSLVVTAGSSRFVLALQTVSIGCVTFLLVVCAG